MDDFYPEMDKHIDLFDTYNYPREHFLFSEKHKKVVGNMKDETAGISAQYNFTIINLGILTYFNCSQQDIRLKDSLVCEQKCILLPFTMEGGVK